MIVSIMIGSKTFEYSSRAPTDNAPNVSPWYAPVKHMKRFLCSLPFWAQYWNAIFKAHSTDAEPLSTKLNLLRPSGMTFIKRSDNSMIVLWEKFAKRTWSNLSTCSLRASLTSSLQCPRRLHHHELMISIYSLPSTSYSFTPFPWSIMIGGKSS